MSFDTLPIEDINNLLASNNLSVPIDRLQAYTDAWELLQSPESISIPTVISDWITAYNIGESQKPIADYTISSILLAEDNTLKDLAQQLSLDTPDKERILRILGWLQALTDDLNLFDKLPHDTLNVLLSNLSCKSILLLCKSSKNMRQYCDSPAFNM